MLSRGESEKMRVSMSAYSWSIRPLGVGRWGGLKSTVRRLSILDALGVRSVMGRGTLL